MVGCDHQHRCLSHFAIARSHCWRCLLRYTLTVAGVHVFAILQLMYSSGPQTRTIVIVFRGDGIAALTCGYLLQSAGFELSIERAPRTYVPALMLSTSSQALFGDILQLRDAFSCLPRIQKRVVKWGPQSHPVV